MTYRFPLWRDKLLLVTLLALFTTGSTYIRVLLRSLLEGPGFLWSYYAGVKSSDTPATVSGHGMFGHTDTLLIGAFVVLWLIWAAGRRPDRFIITGLLGWTTIQLGSAIWLASQLGDDLRVSKETIGLINVSFAWTTMPPLVIAWLLSAALWVRTMMRRADPGPDAPWSTPNTVGIITAVIGCGASAFALNMGAQHGPGDLAGIVLMYLSLTALLLALAPWERKPA